MPATYDFILTRNDIIRAALRKIGAISENATISAEQIVDCSNTLNEVVASWANRNIFLWNLKLFNEALIVGTADYAQTSPIIGIDKAYYQDSAGTDYPVDVISFREYLDIPDKADTGSPEAICVDYQNPPTIYVYPEPDATDTLYFLGILKAADWLTAAGTGDVPVWWQRALTYQLAADIADDYGVPLQERGFLQNKATALREEAKGTNRERATSEFVKGAF